MTGSDYTKGQLALIAWRDGQQESLPGMLAVAFTIRNRVNAGFFNGDWIKILAHHRDYAATDAMYSDNLPDPRNYSFNLLLQEIDGIFSGVREDDITQPQNSVSNTYFRFSNTPKPPVALYYARLDDQNIKESFLENICRSADHKRIASIGTLTFFS